jgi:hypothetical protein
MESVTEGSSAQLTVTFYNASAVAEAPDSATYKVTDLDSGRELLAATSITPISTQVALGLSPTVNAMVNQGKRFEMRVVTVTAVYGESDRHVAEYRYKVNNSRAV